MIKEFLLPELAESVVEGEIVKWLVSEGSKVELDQPIVEVMTDKVTVELPSPYAAILEKHLVKEGEVVPVNAPIARFEMDHSERVELPPSLQAEEERSIVEPGHLPEEDGERLSLFKPVSDDREEPTIQVKKPEVSQTQQVKGPYGRVLAVPAARKLARDLSLDINEIPGSGPNGRVRVSDVQAFSKKTLKHNTKVQGYTSPEQYASLEERVPLRGLRRAISNQMLASHLHTVRTLHVDEADVTNLVALRSRLKPIAKQQGLALSFMPFFVKAVMLALKAFPVMNASLDEEKEEVVRKSYYNIGFAVATDKGLLVPVVHNVDTKSLLELGKEIHELAQKAREGKLLPEDVKGGCFSVSNIGSLSGLFSFPIINVPEAAILGVHSIKKRPVVLEDDSIVARSMLYLSLSFDHRIVDGAEASLFTSYLIELLETPESLFIGL